MRRWLLTAALITALMLPAATAAADSEDQAAQVVAAYFTTAAAEDLEAHLATRDLSPAQRQKAAEFASGVWARVGTQELKVSEVEVAVSPDGGQALARCTVSARVVNKETGEGFAKKDTYVAVLTRRDGQWKVRRMLPEMVFRKVQNEQLMARQGQRLLALADGASAPAARQDAARPAHQATLLRPTRPAAPAPPAAPPAPSPPARQTASLGDLISRTAPDAAAPTPAPQTQVASTAPAAGAPASNASAAAGDHAGAGRVLRVERGMVFIDLGGEQGVVAGQRYEVVAYREMAHPVSGRTLRLPRRVALIQVRQAGPRQSRCLVLEVRGKLIPGLSVVPVKAPAR